MRAAHIVYRALRAGEMESIRTGDGIIRSEGITTPTQHVMGSKHPMNPFVSTTRSLESAQFFATHGGLKLPGSIIAIDLSKVTKPVLDISTPATASAILNHPRAMNFAVKHQEVLIKGGVNSEAIIEVVEE
jgi:hypothetical protein